MSKIYTDGSCLGNPGRGGWGAICVKGDKEDFRVGGCDSHTTNNIMELTAVIRGLERHGFGDVTVYTDSNYVKNGITKWIFGWKKNGWKTSSGTPVKNKELWMKLDSVANSMVKFVWVKAHDGNEWNEKVDTFARQLANCISPDCHHP